MDLASLDFDHALSPVSRFEKSGRSVEGVDVRAES